MYRHNVCITLIVGFIIGVIVAAFSYSAFRNVEIASRSDESTITLLSKQSNSTLIIYSYYEPNDVYKKNLQMFLEFGGVIDSDKYHYHIILKGKHSFETYDTSTLCHSCRITMKSVENKNYDFYTWRVTLDSVPNLNSYSNVILMNSCLRGPFYPPILPSKSRDWIQLYIEHLREDRPLVGLSINCGGAFKTHVQSMLLVMNSIGFEELYNFMQSYELNDAAYTNKQGSISAFEIGFSQALLKKNYNIGSVLLAQQDVDWREPGWEKFCSGKRTSGDLQFEGSYFGISISPFENLFVKINRQVAKAQTEKYTDWVMRYPSKKKFPSLVKTEY